MSNSALARVARPHPGMVRGGGHVGLDLLSTDSAANMVGIAAGITGIFLLMKGSPMMGSFVMLAGLLAGAYMQGSE